MERMDSSSDVPIWRPSANLDTGHLGPDTSLEPTHWHLFNEPKKDKDSSEKTFYDYYYYYY